MADEGFVWDEDKYAKVLKGRDIKFWEVVSVFEDPNCFEDEDPQGNFGNFKVVGLTTSDRLLCVIYSDEDLPLIRIITAFEAGAEDRSEYYNG